MLNNGFDANFPKNFKHKSLNQIENDVYCVQLCALLQTQYKRKHTHITCIYSYMQRTTFNASKLYFHEIPGTSLPYSIFSQMKRRIFELYLTFSELSQTK